MRETACAYAVWKNPHALEYTTTSSSRIDPQTSTQRETVDPACSASDGWRGNPAPSLTRGRMRPRVRMVGPTRTAHGDRAPCSVMHRSDVALNADVPLP